LLLSKVQPLNFYVYIYSTRKILRVNFLHGNQNHAIRYITIVFYVCLNMEQKSFTIGYKTYSDVSELETKDKMLCEQAVQALETSYSPYSQFRVGTAILLNDGSIVKGSNQENVAYPSGLCAERVALFSIGATKPNAVIEKMVITAQTGNFKIMNPVTSCGACLQVMAEFEQKQHKEIEVLFYCIGGEVLKVTGIKNLLPFTFVEKRLGK
jgi:cytidine deaminase